MNNIFVIIGREDGCEIVYTVNSQVRVKRFSCKASKMIYRLAHSYYRPLLPTMRLIGKTYGYHQKIPVLIEFNQLLLFPTISMKDPCCCWINYYCVADFKGNKGETSIFFYDHCIVKKEHAVRLRYVLQADKRVIRAQMKRCHEIHTRYACTHEPVIQLIEKEHASSEIKG